MKFEPTSGRLKSRLESIETPADGIEYAVWSIGQTLASIGGPDLVQAVYDLVEQEDEGTRMAVWLDHRFNGISSGDWVWTA